MNEHGLPGRPGEEEQDLWRQFESTGSVQEYLRYRQAQNAIIEEMSDAEHDDGVGGKGAEGR